MYARRRDWKLDDFDSFGENPDLFLVEIVSHQTTIASSSALL